ncbi:MAG: hypothetical protein K1X67_10260 [Fimbriimonadaceae bacterium]|nr:hypothetical protein [Fimbriimonadaceae bacterium]
MTASLSIIAQTGEDFSDFAPYVASINDDGIVAFQATLASGGSGVFTGNGVERKKIVETGDFGITKVISHPDINNEGSVCFYANMEAGCESALLSRGGEVTAVRTGVGPLGPTMNQAGTVAYRATLSSGESAIFAGDFEVARSGERFMGFHGLLVINEQGLVAFRADLANGSEGIYVWDRGKLETIAETGGALSALGRFPMIDDNGRVAFVAELRQGGSAVVTSTEGRITIADFESIRGVLISESGDLIIYATPPDGNLGIYRHEARILGVGDEVFESTVSEFALNPVSINRKGQLAIRTKLTDGRQFILRADS